MKKYIITNIKDFKILNESNDGIMDDLRRITKRVIGFFNGDNEREELEKLKKITLELQVYKRDIENKNVIIKDFFVLSKDKFKELDLKRSNMVINAPYYLEFTFTKRNEQVDVPGLERIYFVPISSNVSNKINEFSSEQVYTYTPVVGFFKKCSGFYFLNALSNNSNYYIDAEEFRKNRDVYLFANDLNPEKLNSIFAPLLKQK